MGRLKITKMKQKQITTIILLLILIGIMIDITIRSFYCSECHLKFSSQEFNNIASPLISLLGFFGVTYTILLTRNQLKYQQSSYYFNYYRDFNNNILAKKFDDDLFPTTRLLDFCFYAEEKYEELKAYPEYLEDLEKFKKGEVIERYKKVYDKIQGELRLFSAGLIILVKKYIGVINEIKTHKSLDETHKQILLKELFDTQIDSYYYAFQLIDLEEDLQEVKENLYIGFSLYPQEDLKFFSKSIYELKVFIDNDIDLKKLVILSKSVKD